jgi:endonuclease/exonuclease/phosphatase family metal-dependent hydrolase
MLFITYNIQYSRGRDLAYDIERVVDTIKDADVIGLQEVENFWDRSGNISQSDRIAELMPQHYVAWGPTVDVLKVSDAQGRLPSQSRRRQFGNMILSRYPILSCRNHLYAKFNPYGPHAIQRGAIEALIAFPGGPVRVYSTHLDHLASRYRLEQIQHLVEISNRAVVDGPVISGHEMDALWREEPAIPDMPREAILLGDFNFAPTSPEYEWLAGPVHQRRGRLSDSNGFVDAYVAAGHADDTGATIYSDFDAKVGKRIDYCFVSTWLKGKVRSAAVDETAIASDHQPVRFEIDL